MRSDVPSSGALGNPCSLLSRLHKASKGLRHSEVHLSCCVQLNQGSQGLSTRLKPNPLNRYRFPQSWSEGPPLGDSNPARRARCHEFPRAGLHRLNARRAGAQSRGDSARESIRCNSCRYFVQIGCKIFLRGDSASRHRTCSARLDELDLSYAHETEDEA
jgi:hypothetical protein